MNNDIYFLTQEFIVAESVWDGIEHDFEVCFFKEHYLISHKTKEITLLNANQKVPATFYPILLNYCKKANILSAVDEPSELISIDFREDWKLFFRGFHTLREEMVLDKVNNIKTFKKIMKKFNGKELPMAESSFLIEPLKGFFIAYLFWDKDDEFDASLKILFDKRLTALFMQDIVWGVIVETNYRLKNHFFYTSVFGE